MRRLSRFKKTLYPALGALALSVVTIGNAWSFSPIRPRMDLVIASPERPSTPEQRKEDNFWDRALLTWANDTLFELTYLDEFPQLRTILAADRGSFDKSYKNLTIRLKKGLTFANGEPLTAQSFVDSWEKLKSAPKASSIWRTFLSRVQSFEAPNSETLVLRFVQPEPDFEKVLAQSFTAPRSKRDPAAGSGPFILSDWQPGFGLILKARTNYSHSFFPTQASTELRDAGYLSQSSKPLPQIDGIRVDWTENHTEAWKRFREGNADLIDLHSSFAQEALEPGKPWILKSDLGATGIKLETGWKPTFSLVLLNLKTLPKLETRKAILGELDLSFWAEAPGFLKSSLPKSETPALPRLDHWLDDGLKSSEAALLVGSKKKPHLKKILQTLRLEIVGSDQQGREILELAQSRLEKAGFSMESQTNDLQTAVDRFKKGQVDVLILGWTWELPTWRNVLEPIFALQPDELRGLPELSRLEALSSSKPSNAAKQTRAIHLALQNLAVWSPGPRHHRHVLIQPWVFGFHVSPAAPSPERYLRVDRELRTNYLENSKK